MQNSPNESSRITKADKEYEIDNVYPPNNVIPHSCNFMTFCGLDKKRDQPYQDDRNQKTNYSSITPTGCGQLRGEFLNKLLFFVLERQFVIF